jgi:hypothetical protein
VQHDIALKRRSDRTKALLAAEVRRLHLARGPRGEWPTSRRRPPEILGWRQPVAVDSGRGRA